jgi:serine/threonine-protein kinase
MASDVFGIVGTTQAGLFRVERVVAEGGFGVVYRAQHSAFRAPVALKCLKVPEGMNDQQRAQFLEKFREEGELLFRLSALIPTVVRPLHVDAVTLADGRLVPFLALEWLEGDALDVILERRRTQGKPPPGVRDLLTFLGPVAQALSRAHRFPGPGGAETIIHRDLKPENIFVARREGEQVVKILDFGIARAKSAATLHAGRATTESGLQAFTPGYAAPEQWLPKRFGQNGPWTDVWGLAITMVEALAGKPAIDGDPAAMMGTTIDPGRRPTPRAEGVAVPDAVEAAFERALAVDPRQRTQSIDAFWTELETALGIPPTLADASRPSSRKPTTLAPQAGPEPAPVRADAPTHLAISAPGGAQTVAGPGADPLVYPTVLGAVATGAVGKAAAPTQAEPPRAAPRPIAAATPTPIPAAAPRSPVLMELADSPRRHRGQLFEAEPKLTWAKLRSRLGGPIQLALLGCGVGIADSVYVRVTGEILEIGSVRPVWVAGPLVLIGVLLACWRVFEAL